MTDQDEVRTHVGSMTFWVGTLIFEESAVRWPL